MVGQCLIVSKWVYCRVLIVSLIKVQGNLNAYTDIFDTLYLPGCKVTVGAGDDVIKQEKKPCHPLQ